MKLTKSQLKQVIREELNQLLIRESDERVPGRWRDITHYDQDMIKHMLAQQSRKDLESLKDKVSNLSPEELEHLLGYIQNLLGVNI